MKRTTLFLALVLTLPAAATAGERGLLWRVVQTCVAAHDLTGSAFPCLAVDMAEGRERGYAVVRAPFEASHVVITPTVRTIGIEAERLRAPDAPNYFAIAWASRRFATDGLARQPGRDDISLAVNSRPGRSQDQLHVHVDCIRQDIKRGLAGRTLRPGAWTPFVPRPRAPRYEAYPLGEDEFARTNIVRLVQSGLGVEADGMVDVTVVVVGAEVAGRPGFVVLARRRLPNGRDDAHGEALMDHSCSAFR